MGISQGRRSSLCPPRQQLLLLPSLPRPPCRPYTPISTDAHGLDLAVKVYPEGKMGQHLNNLKPGDTLDFKGGLVGNEAGGPEKKASP